MKIRYIIDIDVEYDYENLTELQFKLKDELEEYVKDSELGYYADKTSVKLQDDYCIKEEKRLLKAGRNTLDRINRQKTEIERLKDELHRAKVEISKFYEQADAYCNEAIDVFADSLKIKLNRMIDNLVKEMTEVE